MTRIRTVFQSWSSEISGEVSLVFSIGLGSVSAGFRGSEGGGSTVTEERVAVLASLTARAGVEDKSARTIEKPRQTIAVSRITERTGNGLRNTIIHFRAAFTNTKSLFFGCIFLHCEGVLPTHLKKSVDDIHQPVITVNASDAKYPANLLLCGTLIRLCQYT